MPNRCACLTRLPLSNLCERRGKPSLRGNKKTELSALAAQKKKINSFFTALQNPAHHFTYIFGFLSAAYSALCRARKASDRRENRGTSNRAVPRLHFESLFAPLVQRADRYTRLYRLPRSFSILMVPTVHQKMWWRAARLKKKTKKPTEFGGPSKPRFSPLSLLRFTAFCVTHISSPHFCFEWRRCERSNTLYHRH